MIMSLNLPLNGVVHRDLNENTIDHFVPPSGIPCDSIVTVNLKEITFVTPYAILVLVMLLRSTAARGIRIKIILPDSADVLNYLERMSFFENAKGCPVEYEPNPDHLKSNQRHSSSTAIELTIIQKEETVTSVVNDLADKLISAHGCNKAGVNRFSEVMIETFQNVTQHTNPEGGHAAEGLVAVQIYSHDFHFVIADSGVGIKASLATNTRFAKMDMTDAQAIEGVLREGYSRIDTPGRGGGLQRVQEIAKDMGGEIFIRSNEGLATIKGTDLKVVAVPLVGGTQIFVKCPKRVFQGTT